MMLLALDTLITEAQSKLDGLVRLGEQIYERYSIVILARGHDDSEVSDLEAWLAWVIGEIQTAESDLDDLLARQDVYYIAA